MRLLGKGKRSLLVLPLALWIPQAFLLVIGTQAAHSGEEAHSTIVNVEIVTVLLVILACFGVQWTAKTK